MNIAVFGQSGTGKSTFASSLFASLYEEVEHGLVITDNFDDIDRVGKLLEDEEIAHIEVTSKNIDKINFPAVLKSAKLVAIECVNLVVEEIEEMMDQICERVYETGNYLVYIDEAHIFLPRLKCSVSAFPSL